MESKAAHFILQIPYGLHYKVPLPATPATSNLSQPTSQNSYESPSESDAMIVSKRKRSRLACEPCRERKRKCVGGNPCETCVSWGYECHFHGQKEKRHVSVQESDRSKLDAARCEQQSLDATERDRDTVVRRVEANCSAAFVRNMSLKINPTSAPRFSLFGWNTGARQPPASGDAFTPLAINMTSLQHIEALAQVYFDKVNCCYGFIDRERFFKRLKAR